MADKTKIEWADATWNPITGCSVVSIGCTNCYAMRLAGTRLKHHPSREGLTTMSKAGPVWNGQVRFNEQWLDQPLRWKRPRMIFVCAHGDLFHESVPDEWIDRVFAVMALAPQHVFQVLTKRPDRMREYIDGRRTGARDKFAPRRNASTIIGECSMSIDPVPTIENPRHRRQYDQGGVWHIWMECLENPASERVFATWPLPNVWLGTSVENQATADERIQPLLNTPAATRFISAEPLLGAVDLRFLQPSDAATEINALDGTHGVIRPHRGQCDRLDWVIVGGESGPGARAMHPDWARSLRDQCAEANAAFFMKQMSAVDVMGDRADHKNIPADLDIQDFPS